MGLLKPRKNKKFAYEPRHYDNDGKGSPFQIEHKFDKFRSTVESGNGLKAKFSSAWNDLRTSTDNKSNKRVVIIIGILVLVFLFIIGFDLSIFFN